MIKILACVFMLIDHIGQLFYTESIAYRLVGRLAMPLFAYSVARGIVNTRDCKKYFSRVLLIACISEIPYVLMIQKLELNICFLWTAAIGVAYLLKARKGLFWGVFCVGGVILACAILPIDYGLYGLLWVFGFFLIKKREITSEFVVYLLWGAVHILYILIDSGFGCVQLFTLPVFAIVDICNRFGLENIRISKLLTYFYPIHMIILLTICAYCGII